MADGIPWPQTLWIVRHGQSAGNVARDVAVAAGHHVIDIASRDMDVPLSPLGEQQARALGRWFGKLNAEERPSVILASPYLRAISTATLAIESAGISDDEVCMVVDERLREKEFGIIDRLTDAGILHQHPVESERYRHLGKFYYRPPGGESWCDVILRLRSVIDSLTRDYRGERVLVVAHQVVVYGFRYLLEGMTEERVLAIDRENRLVNCSVTAYGYDPSASKRGGMALRVFNFAAPLEEAGAPVTKAPDVPIAPK